MTEGVCDTSRGKGTILLSYYFKTGEPSFYLFLYSCKKFIKKMIVKLKKGNNHKKVIITRKPEAVFKILRVAFLV